MNRTFYILIGILALALLGFGAWMMLRGTETAPQEPSGDVAGGGFPSDTYIPYPATSEPGAPAGTPDEQAAKAAYEAALATDNPDNIKPGLTVAEGGYAIQQWSGDYTGGEALLKFDSAQGAWTIVDPGGGRWSLEGLVRIGVPEETARALFARLPR